MGAAKTAPSQNFIFRVFSAKITLTSSIGGICARGEGPWQRRLVIHPDNFTYLSVIGRICVRGEGARRQRLQTRKKRYGTVKCFGNHCLTPLTGASHNSLHLGLS